MDDRFVAQDMLVRWHQCWILPSTLGRIREKAMKLDLVTRADVLGTLVDALNGLDVREMSQIPARIARLLGL